MKYIDHSEGRPYYLIPWELINPKYIVDGKFNYYKNFVEDSDGIWFYCRTFPEIVLDIAGITDEIWYKRFVLKVPDDHKITCKYCGIELKFVSISKGYSNGIGAGYRNEWFCSQSCNRLYYTELNGVDHLNSVESQALGRRTQFRNKGDQDDLCAIYICIAKDYYKFGITSESINNRRRLFYGNYTNYKVIFTGTRFIVSEIEYQLKLALDQNHEYFKDFKNFKLIYRKILSDLKVTSSLENSEFY